jgi:hypothetical protein
MSEQRVLFFVRKGVGHALHFARTEVFDNGVRGSGRHGREARRVSERERANQFSNGPLTVVLNGATA